MASSGGEPNELVKLIAYVDEVEGGPPPVTLTIRAKPSWRVGRLQWVLIREYERHLSKAFPEFVKTYTIAEYHAFPPKAPWDEIDHVSDILEKPEGLVGPHIHILATVKEVVLIQTPTTASKSPAPEAEASDVSRERTLNDSAVENLPEKSSTQKEHAGLPSSSTLRRPTKSTPRGGALRERKGALRRDLYEVGDDSEIKTSYEDGFAHSGPRPKRARTDAGPSHEAQTPEQQIPSATPTSAQPRPPTIQSTPVTASSRRAIKPVNVEETGLARGLWTDRENELMLAEIIQNGTETPTAFLRDTLFPGRTTEGIRKRRKKMQNDRAHEIVQGRRKLGLPKTRSPANSKTPAKAKAPVPKPAVSSRLPSKRQAHAVSEAPAILKMPPKTPARMKFAKPRSVPHRRRDTSPVVLIEVANDPSQTQLEIRPGGAVRVKTPNSSQPNRLEHAFTTSTEFAKKGSTAPAVPVPLPSETTPSHDSGFDELVAEEEKRQDSIEWMPQTLAKVKPPRSYIKFLRDARAAAASDEFVAESQLHQNLPIQTLQPDELVSSAPIIPSSPSPNLATTTSVKRGRLSRYDESKTGVQSAVGVSDDPISSSPEKIRSPSPDTAAAWIEVERSSSKVSRHSPGWPEDTPIAKSAIANAETREGVLTARTRSIAVQTSPIKNQKDQPLDRRQTVEDEAEEFDTRKSGQTPRTLNFRARTPRSFSRPIASRRLPFEKPYASSKSDSDSSDEVHSESSAMQSHVDTNVDENMMIAAKTQIDGEFEMGVNVDVVSESNFSADEEAEIDVEMAAFDVDAMVQDDGRPKAEAKPEDPVKVESDMNVDTLTDSDSSDSSSDSDSDDQSDAEMDVKANPRVDTKLFKDAVDSNLDADSDSDAEMDSTDPSDSDSSDSTDSENDDTEAGIRRNVSKALSALIRIEADSGSDVSSVSSHDSDADSTSSESSDDEEDEFHVERDITGSEADDLAEQQLRLAAEQSQKSHDDVSANSPLSIRVASTIKSGQGKAAETSGSSYSDTSSDSDESQDPGKEEESEEEEDEGKDVGEDKEHQVQRAPMATSQTTKQRKAMHASRTSPAIVVIPIRRSRDKNANKSRPTRKTQQRAKPVRRGAQMKKTSPSGATKKTGSSDGPKKTSSFDEEMERKWRSLMGS